MTFDELKQKLKIQQGQPIKIEIGMLTANVDTFLKEYNNSQPIIITAPNDGGSTDSEIIIAGQSNYLQASKLVTTGTFTLDGSGNVQFFISYQLLKEKGDKTWNFYMSFPDLPGFVDVTKSISENTPNTKLLKEFEFYYTYYVLSTTDGITFEAKNEKLSVKLAKGLNFASKLQPTGLMGALEAVLGNSDDLTVTGTIYIPNTDNQLPPLLSDQFPWDITSVQVPGIFLNIDLKIASKIGGMNFNEVKYKIYTPITEKWLEKDNWTYIPVMAYIGQIEIPTNDTHEQTNSIINGQVSSKKLLGTNEVLLNADFGTGLTFKKMEDLVGLAGKDPIINYLPGDVKKKITELTSDLYLKEVGIDIVPGHTGISIPYTYFVIGADVEWKLANGLFDLNGLDLRVLVKNPFTSPEVSLTIMSTIKIIDPVFDVQATYPDFAVYIQLDDPVDIPLADFLKTYADNTQVPLSQSGLSLDTLVVNVVPGELYSVYLTLGESDPFTIDIGKTPLKISDVSLEFYKESGGSVDGNFSGTLNIDSSFELDTSFGLDGNFQAFAEFPEVKLSSLILAMVDKPASLPDGFEMEFTDSTILIEKDSDTFKFLFGTQYKDVGSLAFELLKDGSGWGYAFGIEMTSADFHSLEGLSIMKKFTDFFQIEELILAISSIANPEFQFPDFSVFQNKKITGQKIDLPQQSGGLQPGFFAYSNIHFGGDKSQEMLKAFFGIKEADIGITVKVGENPTADAKLFFSVSMALDKKKHTTIEGDLGIELINDDIAFYVDAKLDTTIKSKKYEFELTLLVVPDGAFISGDYSGPPLTFGIFEIDIMYVAIGIDDAGIPSFGFMCEISDGNFDSSLAVFLDSTEPTNSMVAGAVSNLHMGDVLKTLSGIAENPLFSALNAISIEGIGSFQIPSSYDQYLDNNNLQKVAAVFLSKGNIKLSPSINDTLIILGKKVDNKINNWFVTDLVNMRHYQLVRQGSNIEVSYEAQFVCVLAKAGVTLGSHFFQQQIYVNCQINFFKLMVQVNIDIQNSVGIKFDINASKITIVSPDVFVISSADGSTGPYLSLCTYDQTNPDVKKHFTASGLLNILGLEKIKLFVSITNSGFIFHLCETFLITSYKCDLTYKSIEDFSVDGTATVGIDHKKFNLGPFGHVSVNANVGLTVDVSVAPSELKCSFYGDFEFESLTVKVASFDMDIKKSPFTSLGDTFLKKLPSILINFLASGCGMTQAFGSLAKNEVGLKMEQVLMDLKQTKKGQNILYHYYLHSNELNDIITQKPEIPYLIKGIDGSSMQQFAPVLEAVKTNASDRLLKSLNYVEDHMSAHSDSSYLQYLEQLA